MNLLNELESLYHRQAADAYRDISAIIAENAVIKDARPVSERDTMLITYGNTIRSDKGKSLSTLQRFVHEFVRNELTAVHLLPIYPYSSDDGFSVVDYDAINPELGDWDDVTNLAGSYDLMLDAVINHVSKQSRWFKAYQEGNPAFNDFFIEYDNNFDYSQVVRPRSSPLFHPYPTVRGEKHLWTTFSEDQIDLNYRNPKVLIEILKVLINYVRRGARFLRLDAIGFLWKASGTPCIHHPQAHRIIRIIRYVMDCTISGTFLVSETNVPHTENVSYFGNSDEAHMVYQFPLPPLVAHALIKQNASILNHWVESLSDTPTDSKRMFFNFLASHDGIGMRPVEQLLNQCDRQMLIEHAIKQGGFVSNREGSDGRQTVYELNISYFDMLGVSGDSLCTRVDKFIAAHGILLSLQGLPGIYIHSLLGSVGDAELAISSGVLRRINRTRLSLSILEDELQDTGSRRHMVFSELKKLIALRRKTDAFSPESPQEVAHYDDRIFSLWRDGHNSTVLILINVSDKSLRIETGIRGTDLVTEQLVDDRIVLAPFGVAWIETGRRRS